MLLSAILPFDTHTSMLAYQTVYLRLLAFVCIWIFVVLSMGIFAFATNSKQITINGEGVLCNSWFSQKFIKWADIKDWGLSYCGQTRGEGNTYYLYFSKHECQIKNECKKKLRGKMIKTFIIGNDYFDAVNKIIPFCSEKIDKAPFVGKDKYHFI